MQILFDTASYVHDLPLLVSDVVSKVTSNEYLNFVQLALFKEMLH